VVFVAQGGSYQMRPVTVGAKTAAQVAITRGLQAGDSVVTEGSFILKGQVLKASLGGE
jgi:cobalt-zinc-cadmium efflux system membrane fusion protein